MPPAGFEPVIPESQRPQTHVSDIVATGIVTMLVTVRQNKSNNIYNTPAAQLR
jgi:hypothetical protein